ncbi:MAG: S9 family peptidase [Clostridia bacterium]|nr:S9 family peptidase [Clostridia bacterium]
MNKRLPTFQDCIDLERFTGADYCESRGLLAYASNCSGGVILKRLSDGEKSTVTLGGKSEGTPRFSHDGRYLLFLSTLPEKGCQMYRYDLETQEIDPLGSFFGPIIDPMWSPDGTHVLFASTQSAAKPEKRRSDEPVVIEDFGYKFDGAGYIRPDGHTHLFVLDAGTGEITQLTHGVRDEMHHNWSPDGQHVVYCGNENRPKEQSIGYDLFIVNLKGEKKQISEHLWMVSYPNPIRPVFTPDGKSVIMGVMNPFADTSLGYPDIVFYQFPVEGGEPRCLFEKSDECYQCVQFPYNAGCGWGMDKVQVTPDGKWVYFVSGWKGQGNVYKVALEGDDRHAVPVLTGRHVCHGLGRIQNGKMLINKSETDLPEAYYLLDTNVDALLCKAAQSAEELCSSVSLAAAEDFFFDTIDGESSVHGWVLPPANREPGRKYPAILYIHGGPHPFYTYGLTMEFQCLAAAGFAVLYCNPRGSSSYGPLHQNVKRSKDGAAYMDLLQFVDEAHRRCDWIDSDRLGVTGGSYGGYMTNYIATHAHRFKAYVTQRSVVNDLIGYASSDMQGQSRHYKCFEEFMVNALKESTVSYAERIDKPLLILHGIDDYRTPVEGAHQLFVAVKDLHPDLPVKMVIFPHTSHDQPRHPRLLKLYYQEMLDWFRAYL